MMPTNSRIGEIHSIPVATIHAVTAVPTLAPRSTTWAILGLISSRSTKEDTMSAGAVELCNATVAIRPDTNDRRLPLVPLASPFRRLRSEEQKSELQSLLHKTYAVL